jgi:anti-sigma factor RsiW
MITHSSISSFNYNGCLTAQGIRHYLDGSLKMSDRLMVEEHVRHCRLCSEALKGFRKHQQKNLMRRQKYAGGNQGGTYRMPVIVAIALIVLFFLLVALFMILREYQVQQENAKEKPQTEVIIGK